MPARRCLTRRAALGGDYGLGERRTRLVSHCSAPPAPDATASRFTPPRAATIRPGGCAHRSPCRTSHATFRVARRDRGWATAVAFATRRPALRLCSLVIIGHRGSGPKRMKGVTAGRQLRVAPAEEFPARANMSAREIATRGKCLWWPARAGREQARPARPIRTDVSNLFSGSRLPRLLPPSETPSAVTGEGGVRLFPPLRLLVPRPGRPGGHRVTRSRAGDAPEEANSSRFLQTSPQSRVAAS